MDSKLDTSCEPMEIDLSATSSMSLDISYPNDINNKHEKDYDIRIHKQEKIFNTLTSARSRSITPINVYNRRTLSCNYDHDEIKDYHSEKDSKTSPPIVSTPKTNYSDHSLKTFKCGQDIKRDTTNIVREIKSRHIIFSSILLLAFLLTYNIINIKCAEPLNLIKAKQILEDNLFGQSRAIESIMTGLNLDVNEKILFFYGGTGVGKSYSSSLLLEDVKNNSNVYHFTMPSFKQKNSEELLIGMTVCKTSLIVVDDLKLNDEINMSIGELIERSNNCGNKVTIILIYNCDTIDKSFNAKCDETFEKKLRDAFANINAAKKFVRFDSLTEDDLIKCIEKEISKKNINRDIVYDMLSNFNVAHDGCKGVHSKLKFLNILL